ncbi:MAG TPA: AAA family ATPase [Candidatus Eisenbergiella stercorigallinarum]|uniref:AAA family ATPase n=1 Tax=Candidatus Eisenbergiella stercorigallinarum TaxID=2838557 RepID=A0A9D2R0I9_9FIRM|nr:AAA family ATPase [Candidatus Eisenbergiella stercorigallinarum]
MMLSALLGREAVFESGSTVLILDEIQECPEARTALKFFRTDGRYDVIGTGSLPAEEMSGKGNACSGGSAQPHETAASAIRGCRRHAGRRADLCGHKADGRSAADPEGYCPLLQSEHYGTASGWKCQRGCIQGVYERLRPFCQHAGGRHTV